METVTEINGKNVIELKCMCCNELIGYAELYEGKGAIIKTFKPDKTEDENLEFDQVNSETVQHITDSVQPGIVCPGCIESMMHDSKIEVSYNGKMYLIGHFDGCNNVMFAYDNMSNNVTIEQSLLDEIKLIIQKKSKEAIELKKINKLLNYYSYGDSDREYIVNSLKHLRADKRYVLVNLQAVLGNFSSNEYFLIPNQYF